MRKAHGMRLFLSKKCIPCYSTCVPHISHLQTREFSVRSLNWEVTSTSNEYTNNEYGTFQLTGNKIKIMPIHMFKLSPKEKLKTEYLLSDPAFVKTIDPDGNLKVKFRLKNAFLELSGVHSELPMWEEILQHELDKIHSINIEIPKQFVHLLNLNSADKLQSLVNNRHVSNRVMVKQQPGSKNAYTIIGNSSSVDYFNQILNEKIETVNSKTFELYRLYPSAKFPSISSELDIIPDSCYTINGKLLEFWCLSPKGIQKTESIIDQYMPNLDHFNTIVNEDNLKQTGKLLNSGIQEFTASKMLTHPENEVIFSKLGYEIPQKVKRQLETSSFDSNKLQLNLFGCHDDVKTVIRQIQDMVSSLCQVYIDIPLNVQINKIVLREAFHRHLGKQRYSEVLIDVLPNSRLSLHGPEMNINSLILFIGNKCFDSNYMSKRVSDTLLGMDTTQLPLQYTLQSEEAEGLLKMITMLYPEVKATHSSLGADKTRIHVQGPISNLVSINSCVAYNVLLPILSNVDLSNVVQLCKLLRTDRVIPKWVEVRSLPGQIELHTNENEWAERLEVGAQIRELVDHKGYRYHEFNTPKYHILRGIEAFKRSLNTIAEEYNIFLNVLKEERGIKVEIGGLLGSLGLVKDSIQSHITSLEPVVLPHCESETHLIHHITRNFQNSASFHLVYDNECGILRVGGTPDEIALFHKLLRVTYQETIQFENDTVFKFFCERIHLQEEPNKRDELVAVGLMSDSGDQTGIHNGCYGNSIIVTGTESAVKIKVASINEKLRNLRYFEKTLNNNELDLLEKSQLNNIFQKHKTSYMLIRGTKQSCSSTLLQLAGPSDTVSRYLKQLDTVLDPDGGSTSRRIDMPYAGWSYFMNLQKELGITRINFRKPGFQLHRVFPEVMLEASWSGQQGSPGHTDIWSLDITGAPSEVAEVQKQIQMAMSRTPFRRVDYPVLSFWFMQNFYYKSDLHKEITSPQSGVSMDNRFDNDTRTMRFDITSHSAEIAQHYQDRVMDYLDKESLFRVVKYTDYIQDPDAVNQMLHDFKICPVQQYVNDNPDKIEIKPVWSENMFLIYGEKNTVTEVDTLVRDWIKNFTFVTREFEEDSETFKFINNIKYITYCNGGYRWPIRVYVNHTDKVAKWTGHRDAVAACLTHLDSLVEDTFLYEHTSVGGEALTKNLPEIRRMYKGQCAIHDTESVENHGHTIKLRGDRRDLDAIKDICNNFMEHGSAEGYNFCVMYKDRKVDITFNMLEDIRYNFIARKKFHNWPTVNWSMVGNEVMLNGDPKQIEDFLDFMVHGQLIDPPMPKLFNEGSTYDDKGSRGALLARFTPEHIGAKIFRTRTNGGKRGHTPAYKLFGPPEELKVLDEWVADNLSHIRSGVVKIPIDMSNVFINRGRKGFKKVIRDHENASYIVTFDKAKMECYLHLAAPVDAMDSIMRDVEQFKSRYSVYRIVSPAEIAAYWSIDKRENEGYWDKVWFFKHAIYWDNVDGQNPSLMVMGDKEGVDEFVQTLKSKVIKKEVTQGGWHEPMTEEMIDKDWGWVFKGINSTTEY